MNTPAVEDLQPIADKLTEASQKIYEAVELAAQLRVKPRHLGGLCSIVEHIENVQIELLEAAKRTPRLGVGLGVESNTGRFGGGIGLVAAGRRLGEIQPEEVEKVRAEIAKVRLERETIDSPCAMQGDR